MEESKYCVINKKYKLRINDFDYLKVRYENRENFNDEYYIDEETQEFNIVINEEFNFGKCNLLINPVCIFRFHTIYDIIEMKQIMGYLCVNTDSALFIKYSEAIYEYIYSLDLSESIFNYLMDNISTIGIISKYVQNIDEKQMPFGYLTKNYVRDAIKHSLTPLQSSNYINIYKLSYTEEDNIVKYFKQYIEQDNLDNISLNYHEILILIKKILNTLYKLN